MSRRELPLDAIMVVGFDQMEQKFYAEMEVNNEHVRFIGFFDKIENLKEALKKYGFSLHNSFINELLKDQMQFKTDEWLHLIGAKRIAHNTYTYKENGKQITLIELDESEVPVLKNLATEELIFPWKD